MTCGSPRITETTADGGASTPRAEAAAYDAVFAAITGSTQLSDLFLGFTDRNSTMLRYREMLPDHQGGVFDVLTQGAGFLNDGDLVVHSDHGVAKYGGVSVRISPGGRREEVLVLHYADAAKFFVPVAQAHMVTRYVGVGGKAPALSKLGGASWQKTRKGAEKSVEEFAAKMLTISAERQSVTVEVGGKRLEVRGSIGPFGRTQTWVRVQ